MKTIKLRNVFVVVIATPCLAWIERELRKDGVHFLINRTDCNNPTQFFSHCNEFLMNTNVVGSVLVHQSCGTTFHINTSHSIEVSTHQKDELIDELNDLIGKSSLSVDRYVPYDKLTIGIKCGGSTLSSQNTLNQKIGQVVDELQSFGFRIIFNEPQETYGLYNEVAARTNEYDFKKWLAFIDTLQGDKYHMNTGNLVSGISDLYQKSRGSYSKTGTKQYRIFHLNEEIVWEKPLVQILGTNQEPLSMYEMIRKGANFILFLTGNTPSFTTYVAPIITLSNIEKKGKVDLHVDHITTENVISYLEKLSNAEKNWLYI